MLAQTVKPFWVKNIQPSACKHLLAARLELRLQSRASSSPVDFFREGISCCLLVQTTSQSIVSSSQEVPDIQTFLLNPPNAPKTPGSTHPPPRLRPRLSLIQSWSAVCLWLMTPSCSRAGRIDETGFLFDPDLPENGTGQTTQFNSKTKRHTQVGAYSQHMLSDNMTCAVHACGHSPESRLVDLGMQMIWSEHRLGWRLNAERPINSMCNVSKRPLG